MTSLLLGFISESCERRNMKKLVNKTFNIATAGPEQSQPSVTDRNCYNNNDDVSLSLLAAIATIQPTLLAPNNTSVPRKQSENRHCFKESDCCVGVAAPTRNPLSIGWHGAEQSNHLPFADGWVAFVCRLTGRIIILSNNGETKICLRMIGIILGKLMGRFWL